MRQLNFNFSGDQLRDAGIGLALESAENKSEGWAETAYKTFLKYLEHINGAEFMCEDFREWSKEMIVEPPSERAFGGVIIRAVKNGLIKRVRYERVNNPKAHCANASVWKAVTENNYTN